jgi:antitoxin (DNA-binding transcriptional repressor) of toxin-antitoxin stability system
VHRHEETIFDKVATSGYFASMRTVGLKTLKNKLSEYVRLAAAAETVVITDRKRRRAHSASRSRHYKRPPGLRRGLRQTSHRNARRPTGRGRGESEVDGQCKPQNVSS